MKVKPGQRYSVLVLNHSLISDTKMRSTRYLSEISKINPNTDLTSPCKGFKIKTTKFGTPHSNSQETAEGLMQGMGLRSPLV